MRALVETVQLQNRLAEKVRAATSLAMRRAARSFWPNLQPQRGRYGISLDLPKQGCKVLGPGHHLFEFGSWGATVTELRRGREREKQSSLPRTATSKLRDRGTRNSQRRWPWLCNSTGRFPQEPSRDGAFRQFDRFSAERLRQRIIGGFGDDADDRFRVAGSNLDPTIGPVETQAVSFRRRG